MAKKDTSKLVKKRIINTKGKPQTVYVKQGEDEKKESKPKMDYGDVKPETKKLFDLLMPSVKVETGKVQTASDGEKYRYDTYRTTYKNTPRWLESKFNAAAKANNKQFGTQFHDGDWSVAFDRAKFKGKASGKITMSKLVVIGYEE